MGSSPPPVLLRSGRAGALELTPDPPLGVVDYYPRTHRLDLQPDDRLVLVTDGFLEGNAMRVDIPSTRVETTDRHPREVVRELASHVLTATAGDLRDDATVLCIDWQGPLERRGANAGSSLGRVEAVTPLPTSIFDDQRRG